MSLIKKLLSSLLIILLISLPQTASAYDPYADQVQIEDAGEYYTGDNVEEALQEVGAGTTTDPYYIKRDGTNSPTADIGWGGFELNDVSNVGIGTSSPDSAFHIKASIAGTVGSHSAGQLIIQNPTDSVFSNVVITAYESDGAGNPDQQLWYLGSASSGNTDIIFLNRRNAKLQLGTNGTSRITILGNGCVGIGTTDPASKLHAAGDVIVTGDTLTNTITMGAWKFEIQGDDLYITTAGAGELHFS